MNRNTISTGKLTDQEVEAGIEGIFACEQKTAIMNEVSARNNKPQHLFGKLQSQSITYNNTPNCDQ